MLEKIEQEKVARILALKEKWAEELFLLAHNYQRKEIYQLADFTGDSLQLAKVAAQRQDKKYIVVCGVHFMAESARILAQPFQKVILPEFSAGCPLANMGSIDIIKNVWNKLTQLLPEEKIIPLVYANTSAEVKAFCGQKGGAVCTSSNAQKAFSWGLERADKILFLPDKNLGLNTAHQMNITPQEVFVLDEENISFLRDNERIPKAKVLIWNGFCHVHTFFTVEQVKEFRQKYPQGSLIVHPESPPAVVDLADEVGSTAKIQKFCQQAPPGSVVGVGTEINMIDNLNNLYPEKKIVPLARSLCPNMYKINLTNLVESLEELPAVKGREIVLEDFLIKWARVALENMLSFS